MSNTKRPTTARKVTAKTEANRRTELDEGVRFTIDGGGTWHTLRIGDVTPAVAREVRRETGRGFLALMALIGGEPDLDVVAEAVWVSRRIAGEQVSLDEVEIDYAALLSDDFQVDLAADADAEGEATESPEA